MNKILIYAVSSHVFSMLLSIYTIFIAPFVDIEHEKWLLGLQWEYVFIRWTSRHFPAQS